MSSKEGALGDTMKRHGKKSNEAHEKSTRKQVHNIKRKT